MLNFYFNLQAMWLMLQQDTPQDFVIATGEMHSIREFVEKAFLHIGKTIIWEGNGLDEVGKEELTNIVRVRVNDKYFRPTEVVSILFLYLYTYIVCNLHYSFLLVQISVLTHICYFCPKKYIKYALVILWNYNGFLDFCCFCNGVILQKSYLGTNQI